MQLIATGMRNGETHFEQVPTEVVKNIVRQAAALAAMLEESPALASEPKHPAAEVVRWKPRARSGERRT